MRRRELAVPDLVAAARGGDVRARARLFSLVEHGGDALHAVLAALGPFTGHAEVIGVTGPPGVGKSTLVGRFAKTVRQNGQTVAILAVDPSSPVTGGAVLGDRIRMQDLHGDAGAYVRSLSTRGAVGGLARAVDGMVRVADGLGYDVVLVETVGAGQDESDVAGVAPTVVLVEVPHLGDDIQAIKAGILEVADVLVVNKADREGADQAAAILRAMLSLAPRHEGWVPPVVKVSAATGDGIPKLVEAIRSHQQFLESSGRLTTWRTERAQRQILDGLREWIVARLFERVSPEDFKLLAADVSEYRVSLDDAVNQLIGQAL